MCSYSLLYEFTFIVLLFVICFDLFIFPFIYSFGEKRNLFISACSRVILLFFMHYIYRFWPPSRPTGAGGEGSRLPRCPAQVIKCHVMNRHLRIAPLAPKALFKVKIRPWRFCSRNRTALWPNALTARPDLPFARLLLVHIHCLRSYILCACSLLQHLADPRFIASITGSFDVDIIIEYSAVKEWMIDSMRHQNNSLYMREVFFFFFFFF